MFIRKPYFYKIATHCPCSFSGVGSSIYNPYVIKYICNWWYESYCTIGTTGQLEFFFSPTTIHIKLFLTAPFFGTICSGYYHLLLGHNHHLLRRWWRSCLTYFCIYQENEHMFNFNHCLNLVCMHNLFFSRDVVIFSFEHNLLLSLVVVSDRKFIDHVELFNCTVWLVLCCSRKLKKTTGLLNLMFYCLFRFDINMVKDTNNNWRWQIRTWHINGRVNCEFLFLMT